MPQQVTIEGRLEAPIGRNLFFHLYAKEYGSKEETKYWVLPRPFIKESVSLSGKQVKITGILRTDMVSSPVVMAPDGIEEIKPKEETMANFRGTVTRSTLSGVHSWLLTLPDGTKYELQGAGRGILENGMFVDAQGSVDRKAVSVTMSGPILNCNKITVLTDSPKKQEAHPTRTQVDKNGIAEINNDSEDTVY